MDEYRNERRMMLCNMAASVCYILSFGIIIQQHMESWELPIFIFMSAVCIGCSLASTAIRWKRMRKAKKMVEKNKI